MNATLEERSTRDQERPAAERRPGVAADLEPNRMTTPPLEARELDRVKANQAQLAEELARAALAASASAISEAGGMTLQYARATREEIIATVARFAGAHARNGTPALAGNEVAISQIEERTVSAALRALPGHHGAAHNNEPGDSSGPNMHESRLNFSGFKHRGQVTILTPLDRDQPLSEN